MEIYTERALLYVGVISAITVSVLYFRSDRYSESTMWEAAESSRDATKFRDYCRKWRNGEHFTNAVRELEKTIVWDYKELDFLSPRAVRNFIKGYPEILPGQVVEDQHAALLKADEYEAYLSFYNNTTSADKYHDEIGFKIDELIKREVGKAIAANDYKRLENLAVEYEDWKTAGATIRSKIDGVKASAAKNEWEKLSASRSERELRRFASDYSGTVYAGWAMSRIDDLYSDFDFIKSKGSLRAYYDFARKNPDSPHVNEAWGVVVGELEKYVFKRRPLNASDEPFVKQVLAQYQQDRPSSGLLYGGNYYGSPFQVKTPTYSSDDYFIKLVNTSSGNSVGIYVRGGDSTEVSVPDGTYSVRYATGKKWHGTRLLFGLDAHFSKANQTFTFSNGHGYTLTLQKIVNGNLHTSSMPAQDF